MGRADRLVQLPDMLSLRSSGLQQPAAQAFDFGERRKKKKEKKAEEQGELQWGSQMGSAVPATLRTEDVGVVLSHRKPKQEALSQVYVLSRIRAFSAFSFCLNPLPRLFLDDSARFLVTMIIF